MTPHGPRLARQIREALGRALDENAALRRKVARVEAALDRTG